MNRLLIAFAVTICAAGALCAEGRHKLSPEQIAEREYKHFGGHLIQPRETRVISIANEQNAVSGNALPAFAAEMQTLLAVPVEVNAKENVGLTLRVRDGDSGTPLAVLPDNATAIVNVRALSADGPSRQVLEVRICKELWRGLVYALGGGNTYVRQCVMKQISSLAELDALPSRTACPDAFMRVSESARTLGIRPMRRATYRQACKEGWAPAPTNDIQRVIWAETHQIPDRPLTIEFGQKRDRW